MHDTTIFWLAITTLLAVPGPTNTLLVIASAMKGIRNALALVAAEAAGYSLTIFFFLMLLDPILATRPALQTIIHVVAAAYLLIVATRLLCFKSDAARDQVVSASRVFFATLTNPKA